MCGQIAAGSNAEMLLEIVSEVGGILVVKFRRRFLGRSPVHQQLHGAAQAQFMQPLVGWLGKGRQKESLQLSRGNPALPCETRGAIAASLGQSGPVLYVIQATVQVITCLSSRNHAHPPVVLSDEPWEFNRVQRPAGQLTKHVISAYSPDHHATVTNA